MSAPTFGGQGFWDNLGSITQQGTVNNFQISATPTLSGECAIFWITTSAGGTTSPKPTNGQGWTDYTSQIAAISNGFSNFSAQIVNSVAAVSANSVFASGNSSAYGAILAFFGTNGSLPVVRQSIQFQHAVPLASGSHGPFNITCLQGSALFVMCNVAISVTAGQTLLSNVTASDNQGNTYYLIGNAGNIGGNGTGQVVMLFTPSVTAGTVSVTVNIGGGSVAVGDIIGTEMTGLAVLPGTTANHSQILRSLNFPFSIPPNLQVFGFEVEVSGHQTNANASSILTISLTNPASGGSPSFTTQLPAIDGTIFVGTPMTNWNLTLNPALLNNPNFGINIVASSPVQCTFDIYAVKVKAFLTPNPAPSIDYLKTFAETSGQLLNLFLGSDGVMYQEDAINAPGQLSAVYTAIAPNSFAQSCTQSDREFIAISNLLNGTDIPYTYNGTGFNRCSQVGPGAAPSCSSSSISQNIVSITQPAAQSDPEAPGQLSGLLWSAGPGSTSPGNIVTVYYARTAVLANPDVNLTLGGGVALAGLGGVNSIPQLANGVYVITSTGRGIPPGAQFERWYFTIQQTTTLFNNQANHQEGHGPFGTYQVTMATMTTAAQVPNLEVGNQFQIAGTGGAPPAGYDGTWTVLTTPNASQLQITSTSLNGNVATYGFNLISGTNPVNGQFITVTNTLNGNGIFNIANVAITSTSPGTFSVQLFGPNISSAAETGSGIVFGTIFTFDPMLIVGNKLGGNLVTVGIIGSGTRKCCYSFLTADGYITQPSPITTFTVPPGATNLVISGLLTGPINVIARIIHLTAANGSNFYNIPQPVTVINNGVSIINSSTWVNDNVSTSANFSFSDGVLLTGIQIDRQGNNLFETAELGSCLGFIPYAERIFAISEQNKVTNFLNWSFDGGVAGSTSTFPAGWTVDPTNGAGGSVIASPIFGNAYAISNTSGSTKAIYGMITQGAFQDEFQVPIIQPSTLYSARLTASLPTGAATGQVVIDLFSPSLGRALGTFTIQFAQLVSTMTIFNGTLLTTTLAPVPGDLVLRLYATNILNGSEVVIDRIEIFPTQEPDLSTIVTGSYIDNFEAFDQITGVVSGAVLNQQPVRSAFVLYDVLYLVKTNSFVKIRNVDGLEPVDWGTPTVVSNVVGTPSIYGVTAGTDTPNSGEEWVIIAGQAGAFIYNGGEPIKLSEEIQSLWNQINWNYGHTIWVQNDIINRRILFGVPLKTPNTWLPTGIIPDNANPNTPNVVLELSYKQLPTASHLANANEIRPTYSGKLITTDFTRKWSVWTMSIPAAAFITRSDKTFPIMLGNSANNGKIYQLIPGQLNDDGAAIDQKYITYAFPSSEQEQGLQLGPGRKTFEFMLAILDGSGSVAITGYPNSLTTQFPTPLLPNINLPISADGDVEIPIGGAITGNRCFFGFESNAVGSGFELSRLSVAMRKDPWAELRGTN